MSLRATPRRRPTHLHRLLAAAGLLLLPAAAVAQAPTGSIQGRVASPEHGPVAGAQVVLTRQPAGARRAAVADGEGRFALAGLDTGRYVARVRAPGYRPFERRDLRLAPGQRLELEVVLERAPAVIDAVVTTATRSASALTEVPGAVTVVTREQVAEQTRLAPRLGPMLAQLVPGLGVGTESMSNYGQSLRGRDVLVLIDGVPQSTSRSVSRDFVTIDPAMVERVEVVRGASAMYGDGATGGVINVITRRGNGGPLRFTSEVGVESSVQEPGEGLGTRLSQTVAGGRGAWDFMAGASFTRTGGLFDAEGDRIPPDPTGQGGVAESDGYDLLAKLGWSQGAQRLQLSGNYYHSEQDTDFATDPTVADDPEGTKARVREGLQLDEGQGTENAIVNAEYVHGALLGSQLRAQAYYRDYTTTFGPGDRRASASTGHLIFQSYVQSEKLGTRLELTTPLSRRLDASLHWGADFTHETTSQPVHTFDPEAYDASGGLVFLGTGDRYWVPPMDQRNLGLFAQLRVSPVERLVVRGGVRHERATMDVDPFTALNGTSITGGQMEFTPTLANLGATLAVTPAVSLFANYSQGFSLADLGRVIRQPPAGFTLASRQADAQRVDQYEAGVRGAWSRVQGSIAAYRNTSDLGTSLGPDLEVVRAPERIRGVELALDGQPTATLSLGGTASWTEGEYRGAIGADSAWLALSSFRIQPVKLTAYVEHQATARWRNRVQLLYSGDRDRAYEDYLRQPDADPATPGYGLRPVEHYTTVDLLSRLDVGRGTLSVGVRNLFNAQYFPVVSQLRPIGAPSYSAAPGATVSVSYSVSY